MKNVIFVLLSFLMIYLPAFCQTETLFVPAPDYYPDPVHGAWMLEQVYADSSTADRHETDPETNASLWAEAKNVYYFLPDGTGMMNINGGGESFFVYGHWHADGDTYVLSCDNSKGYADITKSYEPDLDPGYETEFHYSGEDQKLHRYWKDEYQDLDFVYSRALTDTWRMTKVIRTESGKDPVALDPENAASVYAESVDLYHFSVAFDTAEVQVPDEMGIYSTETYPLLKEGNVYTMDPDGLPMKFVYDPEEHVLHRYFDEEGISLDFVYYSVPVRDALKMKAVLGAKAGDAPELLDPASHDSMYRENYNDSYFLPDGTVNVFLPEDAEDKGTWTIDGSQLLVTWENGLEERYEWDGRAEVLHRYWTADDPSAEFQTLDFVYMYR